MQGAPISPPDINPPIGDRDIYLTGNPQITFFKSSYSRHTPFEKVQGAVFGLDINLYDDIPELHLLNEIILIHPDPTFNVSRNIQSISVCCAQNDVLDSLSGVELEYENQDPQRRLSKIERGLQGTIIKPWFFFNQVVQSLPICAMKDANCRIKIEATKPDSVQKLKLIACGFKINDQEYRRTCLVAHEYLIPLRCQFIASKQFVIGSEKPCHWCPRNHRLFGPDFNHRVIQWLCCVKSKFGSVDRNIRQRLIREWAGCEGLRTHTFNVNLTDNNWGDQTKQILMICRDKHQQIIQNCILRIRLYCNDGVLKTACEGELLINMGKVLIQWSFALKPFDVSPTGHQSLHKFQPWSLEIICDHRVHKIEIMGWKYSVLRVMSGSAGLAY